MELEKLDYSPMMKKNVSALWEQYAVFFELEKLEPDYYKNGYAQELLVLLDKKSLSLKGGEYVFLLSEQPNSSNEKSSNGNNHILYHGLGILKTIDRTTCELKRFILYEKSRGKGIGKIMLALFEIKAAELGFGKIILDVFVTKSETALAIYSDAGFKQYKTSTYRAPDDVVYMEKMIESEAFS